MDQDHLMVCLCVFIYARKCLDSSFLHGNVHLFVLLVTCHVHRNLLIEKEASCKIYDWNFG